MQARCAPILLLMLLLFGNAPLQATTTPAPPIVILVSIDGFRPDYLDPQHTPTLLALAADGARVRTLRPAFPSLTFPNHYTLVTGLVPDRHGIIGNVMADPELSQRFVLSDRSAVQNPLWWNDAEPLWNTARKAGLRSATMFWPGSEAPINGLHPHHWRPYDAAFSAEDRVNQVLAWLDLPSGERPHFITLYFDEVDRSGHVSRPDSDRTRAAVQAADAHVAQLVQGLKQRGLWPQVNLLIVSDHGMAATPPEQVVILDDHLPRGSFEMLNRGGFVQLRARPGREAELDAALSRPIEHMQCWRKHEIPARFRYGSHRRITPWVCMGDEGWTIHDRFHFKRNGVNPGSHGFDPMLDSMAAILIAHGPDFEPGAVLDEIDSVDVHPLLMRLLRLPPLPSGARDGDPQRTLPLLRRHLQP